MVAERVPLPHIRPRVFVTRRLPAPVEARMATLFETTFNPGDSPPPADALVAGLDGKDVLVSSITDRIDAAYRAGLTVTNTPSVLTEDTADMATMLMLAVPRRLVEGAQVLPRDGTWPGWSPTWMLGRRLRGKALGIVGMGRIGTAVATRARAFGLNIHYFSRHRRPAAIEEALEATYWPALEQMLPEVDIISLHTPHTRDTYHILDKARLARMRQDAFVVNVSRSELIDEEALVEGIESGHLSGAALDVFENRSGINPRLLELARAHKVVLTAHMASATLESRIEMGEAVIVNIRAFIDGHQPPHRVLPEERAKLARG